MVRVAAVRHSRFISANSFTSSIGDLPSDAIHTSRVNSAMTETLRKIQTVRSATGAAPSVCRAMLESVHWDVEGAIEVLRRTAVSAANPPESPFDDSNWYTNAPLTMKMVAAAEQTLGYKFPVAYIALLQIKNGGCLVRDCFPTGVETSWASDHVRINSIRGIGKFGIDLDDEKTIHEDWGYPKVGFVFADTPTAGHNVFMFDYSACGPQGSPAIIWVDMNGEAEPTILHLAANLDDFMQGLMPSPKY